MSARNERPTSASASQRRDEGLDARLARALASPEQLRILRVLAECAGPCTLDMLAEAVATPPDALQPHLRRLSRLGAVAVSQWGNQVHYALAQTRLAHALAGMLRGLRAVEERDPSAAALADLQLDAVLHQMPSGVAIYNEAGELVRLNAAGERITDRTIRPGEAAPDRQTRYQMRLGDGSPMPEEHSPSGRARRGETFTQAEYLIEGAHGPDTLVQTSGAPLRDSAGRTRGAIIVFHDMTEQRAIEREEARQRALVEAIVEWAPVGIGLYDATDAFCCLRHNAAFLQLVGPEFRASGSIVGVPLDDLFDEDSRARVRAIYEHVRATGVPSTIDEFPAVLQPDPTPRWYRWSLTPLRDEQGRIYALLNGSTEITELVRAREQLRQRAAQLKAVIDSMPEAVALADRAGQFVLTNTAAEALWGRTTPASIEAGEYAAVFTCYSPDGRMLANAELPLPRALAGEVVVGQELTYERPDGGRLDLLCSAAPVYDDQSKELTGGVVVFQDITRMKALERLRDDFLSIAAHELRTPMTTILGMLYVLTRQIQRVEEKPLDVAAFESGLARINTQTLRLNKLIADLLDASRINSGQLEFTFAPCNLRAIIQESIENQRLAHHGRIIRSALPDHAVLINGDATRLAQILDNFLTNALKYSAAHEPVEVMLTASSGEARLSIRDHGPGIPEEAREHLFARFYRVPGVRVQSGSGVGLGLGLYIVRAIVERHGGRVWVESAVGAGSTFSSALPLISSHR